jgi:hypothetical protein
MDSEPPESFDPDQSPEAEHDVALDEDQVKVAELPTSNSESEDVKLTCGAGVIVGVAPPPPPHDEIAKVTITIGNNLRYNDIIQPAFYIL